MKLKICLYLANLILMVTAMIAAYISFHARNNDLCARFFIVAYVCFAIFVVTSFRVKHGGK